MSRYRCWVFTLNNHSEEEVEQLHIIFSDLCKDFAAQEEIGKLTGTPHIQGFLYFNNAKSYTAVQHLIPRAHIEVAKKIIAAKRYCLKSDTRDGRRWQKEKTQWIKPNPAAEVIEREIQATQERLTRSWFDSWWTAVMKHGW